VIRVKAAKLRTEKGVVEVALIISNDRIQKTTITGDFFVYPESALERFEQALCGHNINNLSAIKAAITTFYAQNDFLTPGITVDDWVKVIELAINSQET